MVDGKRKSWRGFMGMPRLALSLLATGLLAVIQPGCGAVHPGNMSAEPVRIAPEQAPTKAALVELPAAAKQQVLATYGKLPLSFEANRGQTDSQAKFLSRGSGHTLFLTSTELVLSLTKPIAQKAEDVQDTEATEQVVLRMQLLGANRDPQVEGLQELPGKSNYFTGKDPKKWRRNIPTYAKVRYRDIYPGIDLVYYGNERRLEHDFVVSAGADPSLIALGFEGADELELDPSGDLVLHTGAGEIRLHKPLVYQHVGGVKQQISGNYVLKGGNHVAFQLGTYDVTESLVIDPVLVYSTYLGGTDFDLGRAIAVDAAGNSYVTGATRSVDFPLVSAFQGSHGGSRDGFVVKISPDGSTVIYSTYLGGSDFDLGHGIAVDNAGNAYVTGPTSSTDFPTVNPLQPVHGGCEDAFVAKLNPTGSALIYSTFLGDIGCFERGYSVAVDTARNAYVAGTTDSANFPTANPLQGGSGGGKDAFVAKLNPAGSALVYSTFLGGSGLDEGRGIAVDGSGNAYVTGETRSANFPTANPLQGGSGGGKDAFVAKLNPAGSALVYSTFLGGSDNDQGYSIALDPAENVYLTGETRSSDFPTENAIQPALAGGIIDAFVAKLNSSGSALVYSTYLGSSGGGTGSERGFDIAVDAAGNAYVAGAARLSDFPTVNSPRPFGGGSSDGFVAKLDPAGSALIFSTFLGGSDFDRCLGIDLDAAGNAYVTGVTGSANFPTANPLQGTFMGVPGGDPFDSGDAFVAKIGGLATFLVIDEDSIDNGNPPNFFSAIDVNADIAEIGLRAQLPFFAANVGETRTLHTGEVGDEGWFALKTIPASWDAAGPTSDGLRNFVGNPSQPFPHNVGPGLGTGDDPEALLDNVPNVTPLRATGLKLLEGQRVCAVVYDSDATINYGPLNGNLKGPNLGIVAFEVISVTELTGFSSSSLPQVDIEILNAEEVCEGPLALPLALFTEAPEPISSSEPFDVVP